MPSSCVAARLLVGVPPVGELRGFVARDLSLGASDTFVRRRRPIQREHHEPREALETL